MDSADNFLRLNNSLLNIAKGATLQRGDLVAAVREIDRVATETLGVERASVWRFSEGRNALRSLDLYSAEAGQHLQGGVLTYAEFPAYFEAMEENRVIDAHDAVHDPRTTEFTETYLRPNGISSMLDAPIRVAGDLYGVICLEHVGAQRHWSKDEIAYAGSLADLVAHTVEVVERRNAEETLRESERRFRSLYEQSPIGISLEDYSAVKRFIDRLKAEGVTDFRGYMTAHQDEVIDVIQQINVVQVNATQLEMFRVDSFEAYLDFDGSRVAKESQNWRKFYIEEFASFAEGRTQMSREVTDIRPDGSRFDLRCVSRIVNGRESDWSEIITTHEDITLRREAEEALKIALAEAQSASRAKSEFLAVMSHEFRTPLNAVIGFSEMLREQFHGPLGSVVYERYVGDIHKSGQALLELVDDVLDLSALEAGGRELSLEEFEVGELLSDCLRAAQHANWGKARLQLELPRHIPKIRADRRGLGQVVMNLLSNALKFTPEGGDVTLAVRVSEEAVTISVDDTGVGIAKKDLPNITKPFARINSDAYVAQEGTGLGLSIVDALCEAMHADLSIESEQGLGTTVAVRFAR